MMLWQDSRDAMPETLSGNLGRARGKLLYVCSIAIELPDDLTKRKR
jgi:hypothetical protein